MLHLNSINLKQCVHAKYMYQPGKRHVFFQFPSPTTTLGLLPHKTQLKLYPLFVSAQKC